MLHSLFSTPCYAVNHRTGGRYRLVPMDTQMPVDDATAIDRIVDICNQPHIYDMLFAERLQGVPYGAEAAAGFLAWGRAGWDQGTHFVFLIIDEAGRVTGAMDIKSNDLEAGEIGYWLSTEGTGVMTNAVRALADRARTAGWRSLYGLVRPANTRSAGVLLRAGFAHVGEWEREGRMMERYVLKFE